MFSAWCPVTAIVAVPEEPAAVAVNTTFWNEPPFTAVTRPVDDTVALSGALDVHVGWMPLGLPCASSTTAVSCAVWPTSRVVALLLTVTPPTEVTTLMVIVPDLPSLVAVMTVLPCDNAVTNPAVDTLATAVLLLLQVMTRFVAALPPASRSAALTWSEPSPLMVVLAAVRFTVATGGTVMVT